MHSGRPSKSPEKNDKTVDQLRNQVAQHFVDVPAVTDKQAVIDDFLASLAAPPTTI